MSNTITHWDGFEKFLNRYDGCINKVETQQAIIPMSTLRRSTNSLSQRAS